MRPSFLPTAGLVCLLLGSALASEASADWEPEGSLGASLHLGVGDEAGDFGGALTVDLWQPFGPFRLGLAGALGALVGGGAEVGSGEEESVSRAFGSLGLSLGLAHHGELLGGSFTARVGGWGGANEEGRDGNVRGGLWLTAGGSLDIRFDEKLMLSLTADFWLAQRGSDLRMALAPGLALRWVWPEEEATDWDEPLPPLGDEPEDEPL